MLENVGGKSRTAYKMGAVVCCGLPEISISASDVPGLTSRRLTLAWEIWPYKENMISK